MANIKKVVMGDPIDKVVGEIFRATDALELIWRKIIEREHESFDGSPYYKYFYCTEFVSGSYSGHQISFEVVSWFRDGEFNTPIGDNITGSLYITDGEEKISMGNTNSSQVRKLGEIVTKLRFGFNPTSLTRAIWGVNNPSFVAPTLGEMMETKETWAKLQALANEAEVNHNFLKKIKRFISDILFPPLSAP